jgi:hypothetical protein
MSTYDVAYGVRLAHEGRHRVQLRRNPFRALRSFAREVGDVLWGSFMTTID